MSATASLIPSGMCAKLCCVMQGLNLFSGGVLMVSHDQFLIEACVDELWSVEQGTVAPFHGTFADYKRRLRASSKK